MARVDRLKECVYFEMGEGEEIEIKDVQIVDSLPLYANKRLEVIYMDVH